MQTLRGRFAPSPSGRMHLGNLFSALLAWLSVRRAGGVMVLRMEDLDPDRCRPEYARQLADDLRWLGLDWDEGWQKGGPHGPYLQSERTERYAAAFRALEGRGLVYPCFCTRAERLAASAPHRSDGQAVYAGKCRHLTEEERAELARTRRPAWRIAAPDRAVSFTDGLQGPYSENLLHDCGDFILRRSDGVYAYQLAVVYDDGDMGVTQVVRGRDLLSSTPRQLWLYELLGLTPPEFYHGGCPSGSATWTWGPCGSGTPRNSSPACWPSGPGSWTGRSRRQRRSWPPALTGQRCPGGTSPWGSCPSERKTKQRRAGEHSPARRSLSKIFC